MAVSGTWSRGSPGDGMYEPPEPDEFEVDRVEAWSGEKWEEVELSDAEWGELDPLLEALMNQANSDPHFFGDDDYG